MSTKLTSGYYKDLTEEDKKTYEKKLTLSNGVLLCDPYDIADHDLSQDETELPDISFPDVSFYLVETPSEFTRDKIRAYKSLEAYNFFLNGHVQDVFIHKNLAKNHDFVFIKSLVLPSQRQGQTETLYNTWVAVHKSGWILSGNCTCMSG